MGVVDNFMLATINLTLGQIDPWWIIFCALLLICIDWFLLDSEVFLIFGIAVLKFGIAVFIMPSSEYLIWFIPLFLFTSFFFQRSLLRPLINSKLPDENLNIVGKKGIIQKFSDDNASHDVFYQYDTALEKKPLASIQTANIVLPDGRQFTVSNGENFKHGQTVKITTNNNGIVTVREI